MINTLKRATKLAPWLAVAAILATAASAFAQAPSQAQRDAIKSQCRSDYMAHCSSGAAGRRGLAAMPAEEHVEPFIELPERGARGRSAGSRDCRSRPTPRRPPAAATAAPKAAEPKAAAAPQLDSRAAHRFPPSAAHAAPIIQRSARACRPAARRRCNAWKKTRQNSRPVARKPFPPPAAVPRQRQRRLAPAAAGAAAAAAPAAPAVIVLRPMRPREELLVLRSACGADVRSICGGVQPGGGRIVQCLATNAAQLSPACKDVLSQFAAR